MAFNQNHMIIALLDSLDLCISFIHSQFVSICGNSYVIFKTIERYQTLGQFCWSLYVLMLQIEGQMLHRVILSLLGIPYVLMDSAHTVPPISGMDSVYPLYLCTRITQSV